MNPACAATYDVSQTLTGCAKCGELLGPELRQVTDKGECAKCGEVIAKP